MNLLPVEIYLPQGVFCVILKFAIGLSTSVSIMKNGLLAPSERGLSAKLTGEVSYPRRHTSSTTKAVLLPPGEARSAVRSKIDKYSLVLKQKAAFPERNAVIFAAMDHTARSTLLERRHLVQAYTWHGVPLTTALTRLTLGLTARLERLWEWETLIPKVTPLPQ